MSILSKEKMVSVVRYIDSYYNNFQFDFNNLHKIEVWYDVLKNFSDEDLTELVKSYCFNNIYPPLSPTSLLQYRKEMITVNKLSAEKAWEFGYEEKLRSKFRFDYRGCIDWLKENGYKEIGNVFESMIASLENVRQDTDTKPFVRNEFIRLYNEEIKQVVKQTIELTYRNITLIEGAKE